MKLEVDKQKLLDAVVVASRVVGKKESLPVLSCILLNASKNTLTLKATNLESGVDVRLPAHTEESGICAVPAHIFIQTIRTARAARITLEMRDKKLACLGGGTTTIHTIPHEEFPKLPAPEGGSRFTLSRQVLMDGIRSVAYAASTSTIRQEFASIFITYKNNLVFVATDSFRLAEKKITGTTKKTPEDVLIPAKNALDLLHILEAGTDDVECTIADSQIHTISGTVSFISRVIDGTFPDYEAIIPKKATTEATLLKEDLASVLQKASVFSGDTKQIGFHIYPKKKVFSATAHHASVGEMSDSIDAAVSGEDIDIHFNIPFIGDCLNSFADDSITLKFAGTGKPLVIEGVTDKTFRYLVMPLNR